MSSDRTSRTEADASLLERAQHEDLGALGDLVDRHGEALVRLAFLCTGHRDTAVRAVADALDMVCAEPSSVDGTRPLLHELARLTFLACRLNTPDRPLTPQVSAAAGDTGLSTLDRASQCLLGLTLHGSHTYREAAVLLRIAPEDAARSLVAALRTTTSRHARSTS